MVVWLGMINNPNGTVGWGLSRNEWTFPVRCKAKEEKLRAILDPLCGPEWEYKDEESGNENRAKKDYEDWINSDFHKYLFSGLSESEE